MKPKEILDLRNNLGLTQQDFAVLLGTTTTTVCRWETGKNPISKVYIREINRLTDSVEEKHIENGYFTCCGCKKSKPICDAYLHAPVDLRKLECKICAWSDIESYVRTDRRKPKKVEK